jgi:hypothetical protein
MSTWDDATVHDALVREWCGCRIEVAFVRHPSRPMRIVSSPVRMCGRRGALEHARELATDVHSRSRTYMYFSRDGKPEETTQVEHDAKLVEHFLAWMTGSAQPTWMDGNILTWNQGALPPTPPFVAGMDKLKVD